MNICLFIGPTLRREEIAEVCEADCMPPVAQGDVYRAAQRGARAIGIIDGFFNGAPAVWHKEILWALSQGIQVFGSASMGALRAAELHSFGMLGVGHIFEAFRDGKLTDDDEVAVVHGPAELGFIAASEAMVNIRATLARAEAEGVLGSPSRRLLEVSGKSVFFPHRTWPTIIEGARAQGVPEVELAAFRDWLPHGRVDQKRDDALAMLRVMNETLARPDMQRSSFQFERTHFWNDLVAQLAVDPDSSRSSAAVSRHAIIEELRLEGEQRYRRAKIGALLRLLAGLEADRRGIEASAEQAREALSRMRRALGLFTRSELGSWLARNELADASLERLIRDQVRLEAMADFWGASLEPHLLDELRMNGDYERLAARAEKKHAKMAACGIDDAEGVGPAVVMLRAWFFEQRLGRPMPEDMEAFTRELGFGGLPDFDGALRREWIYLHTNS